MAANSKQPVQPRDARIVSLILQSLGVEDYDPKVVHQLLEFAHRKKLQKTHHGTSQLIFFFFFFY